MLESCHCVTQCCGNLLNVCSLHSFILSMLIKFHEPASGYNSKNTQTVLIPVEAADQEGVSSGPVCRAVGLVSFGTWDINAEKENRRVGSGLMVVGQGDGTQDMG